MVRMAHDSRPLWVPLVPTPYGENALCLELCNTASRRGIEVVSEGLGSYEAWLEWASENGAVSGATREKLARRADEEPAAAAASVMRAIAYREAVFGFFSPEARRSRDPEICMDRLNAGIREAMAHLEIKRPEGAVGWERAQGVPSLDEPLWACALSAAELAGSPLMGRICECASDTCGWLFLDLSRNRSRRWCDMQTCGNRAKAHRFHARHRSLGDDVR